MKKGILFIILSFLFIPCIVLAESDVSTEISGVMNANPGDTVAYDIKITTSDDIKAITYKAMIDYNADVLELITVTGKDWIGTSISGQLEYNYKDGVMGTSTVATITFKVKDNVPKQTTVISLKEIGITTLDEDGSMSYKSVSEAISHKVSLSIKSTDNTLKSITINNSVVENFQSNTFEYEINVSADISIAKLQATPNNSNATFVDGFGNREVNLSYGENEALIKVKAESGEIQVYKLTIIREDDRNTNNTLKEVVINSGKLKLELSKNQLDYTLRTYKLKEIEVDAVAMDPKAQVDIVVPKEVIIGDNVVIITVTSEVGEERVYTITFQNTDEEIDTKLKTLYIKGVNTDFDKNTMVYEVVYNKKYKNGLDISVVPVSSSDLVDYEIMYNGELITEDTKIELKVGDKYEIKVFPLGMEAGDYSDSTTYTILIVEDTRINFFFAFELLIILVLIILIVVQLIKKVRKNKKSESNKGAMKKKTGDHQDEKLISSDVVKKEINKTKVITPSELEKIKENSKK